MFLFERLAQVFYSYYLLATSAGLILLGFAMVAATYLAVFPDANQLRSLQAQVKPFASLYSNPKKLDKVMSLVNEKKQAVLLSEVINKQWMLLLFNNAQCNASCIAKQQHVLSISMYVRTGIFAKHIPW